MDFLAVNVNDCYRIENGGRIINSVDVRFVRFKQLVSFGCRTIVSPANRILCKYQPRRLIASTVRPLRVVIQAVGVGAMLTKAIEVLGRVKLAVEGGFPGQRVEVLYEWYGERASRA